MIDNVNNQKESNALSKSCGSQEGGGKQPWEGDFYRSNGFGPLPIKGKNKGYLWE